MFTGSETAVGSAVGRLSWCGFECLAVQNSQSEAARLTVLRAKTDYMTRQNRLSCTRFARFFDLIKTRRKDVTPRISLNVSDMCRTQENGEKPPCNLPGEGAHDSAPEFQS